MDIARVFHAASIAFISYAAQHHYLYSLLDSKYGFRKSMCFVLPFSAAISIVFALLARSDSPPLWIILPLILIEQGGMLLIWKLISRTRILRLLLVFFSALVIFGLGNAAGSALYVVLQRISGAPEQGYAADMWMGIMVMVAQCILLLTLERPMQRLFGKNPGDLKYQAFIWVLVAEVVGLVMVVYFSYYTHHGPGYYLVNAGYVAICFFADWNLFHTFRDMVKSAELERDMLRLNQQQALQRDAYRNLSEQVSQLRQARHDYLNALTTIGIMLNDEDDRARTVSFVRELQADARKKSRGVWTGNQIVDAVLTNKQTTAEAKGIAFHAEMLWPKEVRVSDVDLMSLFSNLLDNAIEYCDTLPAEMKREIRVCTKVQGEMLFMDVANTYLGDVPPELDMGKTSKPDATAHGFGLDIVRQIAERANSTMSAIVKDDMLHMCLLLSPNQPSADPAAEPRIAPSQR